MLGTGMSSFIKPLPQAQKEGITSNYQSYSQLHRTYVDDLAVTPKHLQRRALVNGFGETILTPLGQKAKVTSGESTKTTPVPQPLQHVTVEQLALEQESPIDTTIYLCTN